LWQWPRCRLVGGAGFSTIGYDPSPTLLEEARAGYPNIDFRTAALPDLAGVAEDSFYNVLCETVIMRDAILPSVRCLITLLKPNGILCLSWRVSAVTERDRYERLYTALDTALVTEALTSASILFDDDMVSKSSGRRTHRIVATKSV
jgi:SAM-dependent methyltransferase